MLHSTLMVWPKALVWVFLLSIATGASMATCVGANPWQCMQELQVL